MAGMAIGASWCGPIESRCERAPLVSRDPHRAGGGAGASRDGACRTTQRHLAGSAQCPYPQDARLRQTGCYLGCAGRLAALRSQLPASPSGFAVAWWGRRVSLPTAVSGDGFGADRSSLVVPTIVDDSDSYHPLMGLLPIFGVST